MTATFEPHVARRSWSALGTTCTVLVTDGATLEAACATVVAVLELADVTYSRFRADSELSRLNTAGRPTVVSPLLARALEAALRAARLTDGAVDPTVGRAMRALGYGGDFAALTGQDVPLELRVQAVPGWQAIGYQGTARRVSLPRGIELDLGSVGKALAADHAAAAAHRVTGTGVLVSLGGDIAVAGAGPAPGWPILVADDSGAPADGPGEVVRISAGAIATSSTTVRRWTQDGIRRHHLVDPATGEPAVSPWRTATVAAGSCVDANTIATAAIVKGDRAPDWLAAVGLPARLVAADGRLLHLNGWPRQAAPAA